MRSSCGPRLLHLYVAALATLALAVVALTAATAGGMPPLSALLVLVVVAVAAERGSVRVSERVEVSIALVPVLFAAMAFGPLAAVIVGGLAMLADLRRPYLKWAVYTASRMIVGATAGAVVLLVGPVAGRGLGTLAVQALVAGAVAQALDATISSLTLAVRDPARRLEVVSLAPALALSVALYAPPVGLLVFAYERLTPWSLLLFLVPAMAAQRLFVLYQRERHLVVRLDGANSAFASALVAALEARDRYTAGHSDVVARHAQAVARVMGLSEDEQLIAYRSGLLHDVGKVAISPAILEKPGHLTDAEWEQMENHPVVGETILATAEDYAGIANIVRHHHERFDGAGYPDGIAGAEIPLVSRIVCVADAYSAMRSVRPYRGALAQADAQAELWREAGRQFDPDVVTAFQRVLDTSPEDQASDEARTDARALVAVPHRPRTRVRPAAAGAASESFTRLADIFHELLAEQSADQILDRIADALSTLVPYSTLTIYDADDHERLLVPTLVRDCWASEILANTIRYGEGLTGWVAEHREPLVLDDAAADPRAQRVPGTPAEAREALICIPLIAHDAVKGVLNIYREGGENPRFEPEEFELARRFADAAALALHNAQMRRDLEHRAQTDSLTGLYNHRHFHDTLASVLRRGNRKRVCVLMLDIDNFKQINDTHGHAAGDRALVALSNVLPTLVRDGDTVCRIGGEEIGVVMPGCDEDGALSCAGRIHGWLRDVTLPVIGELRVSIGIASSTYSAVPRTLADSADAALRAAKAAGKDRTLLFRPSETEETGHRQGDFDARLRPRARPRETPKSKVTAERA